MLRNGHVLFLNSLATGFLGVGYWALASRWYDPAAVGLNFSAISAMMLLAGIGQLNLTNVLIRFVPADTERARRLVTRAYMGAFTTTLLTTVLFLVLIPELSPELGFLRKPLLALSFVAATAGYAVFILQDGVLTGLRRPGWVLLENSVFGVAKIVFAGGFALVGTATGLLHSWFLGLAIALLLTNAFLFTCGLPKNAEQAAKSVSRHLRPDTKYVVLDYAGALFPLTVASVMPLLVLNHAGAEQTAYFSIAWSISLMMNLLNINMCSSLVVEAARDPERLPGLVQRMLKHTMPLMLGCVLLVEAAAPLILRVFGPAYAHYGTAPLRVLVLAALPHLIISTAVSTARVQRRMAVVVGIPAAVFVLVIPLAVTLLPLMGLEGAGVAWLIGHSLVAVVLLCRRSLWLPSATTTQSSEGC